MQFALIFLHPVFIPAIYKIYLICMFISWTKFHIVKKKVNGWNNAQWIFHSSEYKFNSHIVNCVVQTLHNLLKY